MCISQHCQNYYSSTAGVTFPAGYPTASPQIDPNAGLIAAINRLATALEKFNAPSDATYTPRSDGQA